MTNRGSQRAGGVEDGGGSELRAVRAGGAVSSRAYGTGVWQGGACAVTMDAGSREEKGGRGKDTG